MNVVTRRSGLALLLACVSLLPACSFDELSVPLPDRGLVRIPLPDEQSCEKMAGSTRQWLQYAYPKLERLLSWRGRCTMLTEDMLDGKGEARDPYRVMHEPEHELNWAFCNYHGITHTAQGASRSSAIETTAPQWPGFEDIWIPVGDGFALGGRIGFACYDGKPAEADCIVLLPGMYGDHAVLRTRNLALALVDQGYHAISLELRGHGQAEKRFPGVTYTFGTLEMQDLMRVEEWLRETYPAIRRTGLIGFCWGGNIAMLAAWYDGRSPDDPSISEAFRLYLDPPDSRRHFEAGVMAFSPVIGWESIVDLLDEEHGMYDKPIAHFFQRTVKGRMERKGYSRPDGSLRRLIASEFAASELTETFPLPDAYTFLRYLPYRDKPVPDKMSRVRVPMLITSAVNDPFLCARDLPQLVQQTSNPLVAAMVTKGGGHVGFAPYNPRFYYSLILNFFDPEVGAAACTVDKPVCMRGP